MNAGERLMARKLFRLRVHQAKGDAYQSLFEQVMGYTHNDFVPIRPYGNQGDRKNDGYCRSSGVFYQVYAPDQPVASRTVSQAAVKAHEDFVGMMEHWSSLTEVNEYQFVFNDEFTGCPAPVELKLLSITKDYGVPAYAFLAKHLEDLAMNLCDDQLMDVIQGQIPELNILDSVDFTVLGEVILHILDLNVPETYESTLVAPDFESKIEFNGLSRHIATLLTYGSYQSEAVNDYLSKNSSYAKQQMRDQLASLYMESISKLAGASSDDDFADLVFLDMLKSVMPVVSQGPKARLVKEASIVVLAFYFEACDIFEEPNAAT